MVYRAEAARMTVDRHIVGRVGEDHRGALLAQQRGEGFRIEPVATQDAVGTEEPQIAELADSRPGRDFGEDIGRVVALLGYVIEGGDPQVNLAHLEAGDL